MARGGAVAEPGRTSLLEKARLAGEFWDWNNLVWDVAWLEGELDLAAVRDAWRRVCLRHDALRRTYVSPDEALTYPDVLNEAEFHTAGTEAEALEVMRQALGVPFSLEGQELSRIVVVRCDERRHLIGLAMDHIITDGMSWDRVLRDFIEFYQNYIAGEAPNLAAANTYQSFASRQRAEFDGAWGDQCRAFWHSYMAEFGTHPCGLRAPQNTQVLTTVDQALPAGTSVGVNELARRARATPFAAIAAGLLVGLRELSGDQPTGLAATSLGRVSPGTADTVGLFIRNIPLHLRSQTHGRAEAVREVFTRSLDICDYNVPLQFIESGWNEYLESGGLRPYVYLHLDGGAPTYKAFSLPGISPGPTPLNLGGRDQSKLVAVVWSLGEDPHISASFSEAVCSRSDVEQVLRVMADFVSPE